MRPLVRTPLRTAALLLSVFLVAAFAVFLINQTVQIVGLADRVHPVLGTGVLWALLLLYAGCALVPCVMLLRLPRPLTPPASEAAPGFEAHLDALRLRLRGNSLLAGRPLSSRQEIEAALRVLDARADEVVRSAGARVFVATAVSQNGSLDGAMVLLAQTRMLWQIARVYYQRPTLRDLAFLYANVASTAFLAAQLDDVDVAEQIQPLLSGVLGSAAGAVPGFHAASSLFVNSVMTGTANAFLTLRVGIVAMRYCGALTLPEPRTVRRLAVSQAAQMLGSIARHGAKRVAAAFWSASATRAGDVARGAGESAKQGLQAVVEWLGFGTTAAVGGAETRTTGEAGDGRAGGDRP
jgi:hypothetical protein